MSSTKGMVKGRTHLAGEWHHVVLAETEHVDVTHDDHLVVVFGKDRIVDHVNQSLLVPFRHPQESLGVSLGRSEQALSIRVLAYALEDGADSAGQDLDVGYLLFRRGVEAALGVLCCDVSAET